MDGKTSLSVSTSTLERFKSVKQDAEGENYPHDRFLNDLMDTFNGEGDEDPTQNGEYERWSTEVEHQQRLLQEHAKTQELLEHLPQDIADELEGRMR